MKKLTLLGLFFLFILSSCSSDGVVYYIEETLQKSSEPTTDQLNARFNSNVTLHLEDSKKLKVYLEELKELETLQLIVETQHASLHGATLSVNDSNYQWNGTNNASKSISDKKILTEISNCLLKDKKVVLKLTDIVKPRSGKLPVVLIRLDIKGTFVGVH